MSEVVVEVTALSKSFAARKGLGRRRAVDAVRDVTFSLRKGETTALVGESGCGKTTLALMLLGLLSPSSGSVRFPSAASPNRRASSRIGIVFQDPFGSLQPRMRIGDALVEVLDVRGIGDRGEPRRKLAMAQLEQVGIPSDAFARFPNEFSGGQRQRIAIARALISAPEILVLDEPTSALDMSVQSQILNLLNELKEERELTYLLITHNMDVVAYMSDHVLVMDRGSIVESGTPAEVLDSPASEAARRLIASRLSIDPDSRTLGIGR